MIGTTLAQFRFTAKLGEGGMGEVYRAEDTRLGREVAIKVLPSEVKHDADRLSRFEREARILASLNHPNIAGLLQIEDIEDRTLLVMELVEGEDVADRLARGPIPVIHAIELARQIATGLEVAHERGIVHRDLKPANVKVSADDQVKILDFGLAKIWESVGEGSPVLTDSPTMTAQMTRAGVVLGTAAYMSPEQARGDAADQRSDIWSFGTVLYEMLTGERLFLEPTASDTLASVLRSDIDWGKLPGECPPGLRRLLRRCLEREPRRRYHAVADVRLDLEDIAAGSGGVGITETMSVVSWKGLAIAAGLGAVLASLIAMIAVGFIPSSPSSAPGMRSFEVVRGVGVNPSSVYSGLNRLEPRVSPDGSMVLYPADGRLWIRDIARLEPRPLEGTDGTLDAFWSPDSASIAYVVGNELRRMSAQGGPGIVLTRLDSFYVGGCWGTGDRIVISLAARGLFEIPARGGDPQLILAPDRDNGDFDFHAPTFLGDSETIAFTLHPQNLVIDTVEVFDGHERKVVYKAPDGSQLTGVGFDPISSHLLVATVEANAGLWAIPLDLSTGAARGDPRLVVPDGLAPSATADGTLVFVDGLDFAPERLVRVDRAGKVIGEVGQALWDIRLPVASPDGKRVATRARHRGPGDLWVHDVDRETALRITSDPGGEFGHAWADGGDSLVYATGYGEVSRLVHRKADGTGESTVLLEGKVGRPSLPLDGRFIVYQIGGQGVRRGQGDIWWFPTDTPEAAAALVATPADEVQPAVSPDGKLLAYTSDESGQKEIYLRAIPTGTRHRVSSRGGELAIWNRSGDELFYVAGSTLMAVKVGPGGDSLGSPVQLFSGAEVESPLVLSGNPMVTIGPQDDFLVVRRRLPGNPAIVAIQGWTELLSKR